MAVSEQDTGAPGAGAAVADPPAAGWRRRVSRIGSLEVLLGLLIVLVMLRAPLADLLSAPAVQAWLTVFVAIVLQAVPFLVGGVAVAAAIAVYVPRSFWRRVLPARPALAVPVATGAGAVLPGCECGAVPIASSLVRRGVSQAAALAFLLAAPAINPVVLVATAVAFPGNPELVLARALASALVAMVVGWVWIRLGRGDRLRLPRGADPQPGARHRAFWAALRHDVLLAGGFLVVGAAVAATVNVALPAEWVAAVAEHPWLAVLALAVLAVLLSLCSEADAFVAASLTAFPLTARLVFLVVGPVVDLKLISMQVGVFGRRFAATFAPLTFAVAVGSAVLVGWVVL